MIVLTNFHVDPAEVAAVVTGTDRRVVIRGGVEIPLVSEHDEKWLLSEMRKDREARRAAHNAERLAQLARQT